MADRAHRIGASALLAWERGPIVDSIDACAVIDALASRIGRSALGIVLELDRTSPALMHRFVEIGLRRETPYLPLLRLHFDDSNCNWALDALRDLASHGLLFESAGFRYLIVAESKAAALTPAIASGIENIRNALGPVRIGWRQSLPRSVPPPPGFDFTVEWQPLDLNRVSDQAPPVQWTYSQLICDTGKRVGRQIPMSPSVLWSPRSEVRIAEKNSVVNGISASRIAHCVDVAARYVRNREGQGIPFWILRAEIAPADLANSSLDALARLLDETRDPAVSGACDPDSITIPATRSRIAVVLHLYYPELWPELWSAISQIPEPFDLYVSCPFRLLPAVRQLVSSVHTDAVVFGIRNLGRDVLPFLLWLRAVGEEAYSFVLKLHTKRSKHLVDPGESPLGDGNAWRTHAVESLVGSRDRVARILDALEAAHDVGLVAPSGRLFDQMEWQCATGDLLNTLLSRLGRKEEVSGRFPAGTMFWAQGPALVPLAGIPDELMDFEREAGQVDGTLHHAYERAIAHLAQLGGFRVLDTEELLDSTPPRVK